MSIAEAVSNSRISLESLYGRVTSPPSTNIGNVLRHLQKQHKPRQLVHFLVDEFNQELLTSSYISSLNFYLEDYLKDSTVVIALQSVCKNRTIQSVDNTKIHQFSPIDLEECELEIIQLKTCARMTEQLYKLQLNLQKEVELNPSKAILTYKGMYICNYDLCNLKESN